MFSSQLKATDYDSFYAPYVAAVGDSSLEDALGAGGDSFVNLLRTIPVHKLHWSYADGKWTIAELLLHIIDSERVFQYRALRIVREDDAVLSGFDQDVFMASCNAAQFSLAELISQFETVRQSTLSLYRSFKNDDFMRLGVASDAVISVAAQGFIIAGHQLHHQKILKERYL